MFRKQKINRAAIVRLRKELNLGVNIMSISTQGTVDNICFQIAQLDVIGQQKVFERIEKLKIENKALMSPPTNNDGGVFRISDLWGIGSEIWQGEGVNEYIRKERDSWD